MRFVFAGNWKMNKLESEAREYLESFIPLVKKEDAEIVLCVPSTCLMAVWQGTRKSNIKTGAQNIYYEKSGAFTGEISPSMAKEFADYVIIGHSERRSYFKEDNEIINKKIKAALEAGLKVIFCIGERFEEREEGRTERILEAQINQGLAGIVDISGIVFAYEPVWAIGTGKNALPDQIEETHLAIRKIIDKPYGRKAAKDARIIYGGSVTPENAEEILKKADVNGCLPGGASLDPVKFSKIIKSRPK